MKLTITEDDGTVWAMWTSDEVFDELLADLRDDGVLDEEPSKADVIEYIQDRACNELERMLKFREELI